MLQLSVNNSFFSFNTHYKKIYICDYYNNNVNIIIVVDCSVLVDAYTTFVPLTKDLVDVDRTKK